MALGGGAGIGSTSPLINPQNVHVRVAIIGAGIAGLVNARVLRPLGVDVTVYEARADIGGVWSATRGYPGQRLQNDKRTYALSDFPMPADYPEHPDRAQVQAYLSAYAARHGLLDAIRLSTTVTLAEHDPERNVWRVHSEGPEGRAVEEADWLIVANGTLSTPNPPVLTGTEEFAAAGGRVVQSADLGDSVDFAGRRVVVLGYGKSGADIAIAAVDGGAERVTVVARTVPWKLPYRIGRVPFQRLVITRLGEHLLWAPFASPGGRALRRADTLLRWTFLALLKGWLRQQLQLGRRGLVPRTTIRHISHIVTPGFDRAVDEGSIDLRTDMRIARLSGGDGPVVHLEDGTALPADLLVSATGYRTDLGFLDRRTRALLHDDDGGMPLYRQTVPVRVPRLVFAGWINSFRSPIASELQALWIAGWVRGVVQPARRSRTALRGRSSPAGLTIVDQDVWLRDLGVPVSRSRVAAELLTPFDPSAYGSLHRRLASLLASPTRLDPARRRALSRR